MKISVITSLYKCEKYLLGYFNAVDKIINKEECEFLLLHNAPTQEEITIINQQIEHKAWFKHIIINKREGLYATWNRGINLASAQYCAVWNVDDIRFPNSLDIQANILDKNGICALVVGELNGTDIYGQTGERYYKNNQFIDMPEELFRSCLIGCFPMWRKSIHDSIGYFDEQFHCVSDFDFQIRVALKYKINHINESLGIYLENDPNKISSDSAQTYENNLLYLRYGAFEKLILHKVPSSLIKYHKNLIVNFDQLIKLKFKKPFNLSYRCYGLVIAIIKLPYYIARDIYHLLK